MRFDWPQPPIGRPAKDRRLAALGKTRVLDGPTARTLPRASVCLAEVLVESTSS
jgi:hypothetical protein